MEDFFLRRNYIYLEVKNELTFISDEYEIHQIIHNSKGG